MTADVESDFHDVEEAFDEFPSELTVMPGRG